MEPTFREGQVLLASSIPYVLWQPRMGDVVVVKNPWDGRLLLKRIEKREGERYFVAGDNQQFSTDSRTFGPIVKDLIVGKVILDNSFKFY